MGWISRLLGIALRREWDGIKLDVRKPLWEVEGPSTFAELFEALDGWLPDGAVLYFEGGAPSKAILRFMAEHAAPEQAHVALGTIWPRPKTFYVPVTRDAMSELRNLARCHAEAQLAIHFHVYKDGQVILQWHDAFDESMLLRDDIAESEVRDLAHRLGTSYKRCVIAEAS